MAKVLGSGFQWADGVTLQLIISKSGSSQDRFPAYLLMEHVELAQCLQILTLALELSFIFIIFSKTYRIIAAFAICSFHVVNGLIFSDVDFELNVIVVVMICVIYPLRHFKFWPWNWVTNADLNKPAKPPSAGSAELGIVWTFFTALFILPLLCLELHPFSILPMYNYRLDHYASYKAYSPSGNSLSRTKIGIKRTSNGSNWVHAKIGRHKPSINIVGQPPASPDAVKKWVRERLKTAYPELPYIDIEVRIYGPRKDKTTGVIQEQQYRVYRENFSAALRR